MLILKCLKTHIANVRNGKKHYNKEEEQEFPSTEAINELKGKSITFYGLNLKIMLIFVSRLDQ
jgi:hypothetical protein